MKRAEWHWFGMLISLLFLPVWTSLQAGQILFQDNFENRSSADWQPLNASNWQVALDQGDYAYYLNNTSYTLPGDNQLGEYSLISTITRLNFVFECDLRTPETGNASADLGIIFAYRDAQNYYNMVFNRSASYTELSVVKKGLGTSIASYPSPLLQDAAYHHVKIERLGPNIKVYYDGTKIIDINDDSFMTGQLGVGSRNDAGYFDNIVIKDFSANLPKVTVVDSLLAPVPSPHGIAFDGSTCWLGDAVQGKVVRLNSSGQTLSEFNLPNSIFPVAMQWISPSYLWIADHKSDLISKVDINTRTTVASFGTPGGICDGLTWDGSHLWITDKNRNAIYQFDLNGNLISSFTGPTSNHTGIVWDGAWLWVVSSADPYLFKIDRTGRLEGIYDIPGSDPRDLTWDGQYFWMTDGTANKIYKYAVSGSGANPGLLNLTLNQIDPGQFPVIQSYVTVTDPTGNPIIGLNAGNFDVLENNVRQSPITVTPVGGSSAPVAVALVLDRSGSMAGQPIVDAQNAALAFIGNISTSDRAAVISFADNVRLDCGFTSTKSTLNTAINGISATGATSLYDAIAEAVNQTNTQSGRKAIIALTDGEDNDSSIDLNGCISRARAAGLPVFTIGLGTVDAQVLQQIANDTGGRYFYAPNSSDLLRIYQLISQQLQNQYKITYTTSNPAFDCTMRDVKITATYQASSDSEVKSYQAPCTQNVPIFPVCATPTLYAGQDFWVEIQVGTAAQPVNNLFAVSFKLNFPTTWLDVITPASSSIVPGGFLGSDLVFFQDLDETAGIVSIGVSRKSGAGGVQGAGYVGRIHFRCSASTPNNTSLLFTLSSLSAIDPNGSPILLTPQGCTLLVNAGATVWPGDANNDGYVDQADILPLGVYFNRTGTTRSGAPNNFWSAQSCSPLWSPANASYADCDGSGAIDQADVFAIGLNWHKSHSFARTASPADLAAVRELGTARVFPVANPVVKQGSELYCEVKITDAVDLFGLSFQLAISDSEHVSIIDASIGSFLGDDILALSPVIDTSLNVISVGMTRKAGQGGVSDSGLVLTTRLRVHPDAPKGNKIILRIDKLRANDESGNSLEYLTLADTVQVIAMTTGLDAIPATAQPGDFRLEQNYPNPFNASTRISCYLPTPTHLRLDIHNSEGKLVKNLVNGPEIAGQHALIWDGTNQRGETVAAGLYFCQMTAGGCRKTVAMLLIK